MPNVASSQPGMVPEAESLTQAPVAKQRKVWPWLLGGVLVMALLGYFVAVPYYQLSQFRKEVQHRHQALVTAVKPLVDTFFSEVTSDTESTPAEDLKEIEKVQKYVKDAQDYLKANRAAMTNFQPLPLLDMTYPGYADMKKTAELEAKYIAASEKGLNEAQAVTEYFKNFITYFSNLDAIMEKAEKLNSTDPMVLANQVDAYAAEMQLVADKVSALNPPADLKSVHDKMVTGFKDLIAVMRDLAKGARTLDLSLITSATNKLDANDKTLDDASDQFDKDYPKTSQMAGYIASIKDLQAQIKY